MTYVCMHVHMCVRLQYWHVNKRKCLCMCMAAYKRVSGFLGRHMPFKTKLYTY